MLQNLTFFKRAVILGVMTAAILVSSRASALDPVSGEVVLTVSGAITTHNHDNVAQFDVALLESMGAVTFDTRTIWTEGVQTFTGVELATLLNLLGVEDGQLRASAVNDYAVDIPVSDAVEGGPIIAFLRNGERMSLRSKGPLWIVYPYDSSDAYQSELIYSRSIWQLDRIEVMR